MKSGALLVFFLLLGSFVFIGCTKDLDDESSFLGEWKETAPISGRTDLYFVNSSRLVLNRAGGQPEEFRFKVEGDSLYLSPEGEIFEESAAALFFKQINAETLKIESFYEPDSIPMESYIIFEREY